MTSVAFTPQTIDMTLYAGDGASFIMGVSEAGLPADVSVGTFAAQLRTARADADAKVDFEVAPVVDDTSKVQISLTGAQTAALMNGSDKYQGFWDIQWTRPGAEPLTLAQGKVKCLLDVTRP